jgi:hypothetical protein
VVVRVNVGFHGAKLLTPRARSSVGVNSKAVHYSKRGERARRGVRDFPSPLAGEGGLRSRSDEGSRGANRTARKTVLRVQRHPSTVIADAMTPSPARGEGGQAGLDYTV